MWAKDAHEGTRVKFFCEIDGREHSGIVGRPLRGYVGRKLHWYVDITLDNPNDLTGPGVALPEDHLIAPINGELPDQEQEAGWSRGEHEAEGRAVEAHQEAKHGDW